MRHIGFAALVVIAVLIPAGCSTKTRTFEGAPIVRVRILENQEQVLLTASSAPTVKSAGENAPRKLEFPGSTGVPVTFSAGGWRIGNTSVAPGELTISPSQVGSVSVNGLAYRGHYRFVPVAGNRFDVVNDVDVDSYLMSVVSKELLSRWHLEAYKTQAIAARTYALYEARTGPSGRAYDLQDDERSQVYGGISAESNISRQSVTETAGVVLAYGPDGQEKIFKTYFSSCCGGIGQSAYDAFGDADIPPLRAKSAGTLCNASPRYNWGPIVLSKSEVTRRVRNWASAPSRNRAEKNIDLITRIDIAPGALVTGRPSRFLLTDSRGNQYSLTAEETRSACNDPNDRTLRLTSSFFKPVNGPDTIQFVEGHGNGHGVGMCQWCVEAMAERGQKHEYIARVSYPGAVLVRAY